jgi:hypothetical protein
MPDQDFKTLQQTLTSHIRSQDAVSISGVEDRRLNIYRELFYNNIESFVSGTFPVLKECLSAGTWDRLVRAFFMRHQCDTPYFLEISEEFLQFLQEHTDPSIALPDYAYSLAHWEWMELFADAFVEKQMPAKCSIDLQADVLTTEECAWLQAYEYPVHAIEPGEEVEPKATFLLIYRDTHMSVCFIELTPLSYLLFESLQNNSNQTIEQMVQNIAASHNMPVAQLLPGALDTIGSWVDLKLIKSLSE